VLEYREGGVSREFPIGLGTAPIGRKSRQGDRKTPEGAYFITHKNSRSQFYLSLGISYPNPDDAKAGLESGIISRAQYAAIEEASRQRQRPPQNTRLGGDIFIHGRGAQSDWTWGCIALDDEDMKFVFEHVRVGDKVMIVE
jgi:murein L,D-transpeptidase YafK